MLEAVLEFRQLKTVGVSNDLFFPIAMNSTRKPDSDFDAKYISLIETANVAGIPKVQTESPVP
jgi:hypothetical protein